MGDLTNHQHASAELAPAPGAYLWQLVMAGELTIPDLGAAVQMGPHEIDDLVAGRVALDLALAMSLERATDVSAANWLERERAFRAAQLSAALVQRSRTRVITDPPRSVVETVEDLDELPVGTVLRSNEGFVFVVDDEQTDGTELRYPSANYRGYRTGSTMLKVVGGLEVLFRPHATARVPARVG